MINVNEAIQVTKNVHQRAQDTARQIFLPYWLHHLEKDIICAASTGLDYCIFKIDWSKYTNSSIITPSVKTYTKKFFIEEVCKAGFDIIKFSTDIYTISWHDKKEKNND